MRTNINYYKISNFSLICLLAVPLKVMQLMAMPNNKCVFKVTGLRKFTRPGGDIFYLFFFFFFKYHYQQNILTLILHRLFIDHDITFNF